jgi:hypothetical protein
VSYVYREAWLSGAVEHFKPDFEVHGYPLKTNVRVACGWPSRRALSPKTPVIGQCFSTTASGDGTNEIFISPILDDPIEVAAVLVHELTHAAVGIKYGHQGPFPSLAVKMGLTGPMRATTPNSLLREHLNALSQELGPYPHATLSPKANDLKKQGTRLLQCVCPACGYMARITKKWIEEVGLPVCPNNKHTPTSLACAQTVREETTR